MENLYEDHLVEFSNGNKILKEHIEKLFIISNVMAMNKTRVVLNIMGTNDEDFVFTRVA